MTRADRAGHTRVRKSYAKRISDHVAVGLVAYTLMLIFVTSPALESEGASILPYFMLVVFVAIVIPVCRNLERRWQVLEASELNEGSLETRFTLDRVKLWSAAIGIPIILAVLFTIF